MKQPEWQRGGICGTLSSKAQQLNLEPSEQREREQKVVISISGSVSQQLSARHTAGYCRQGHNNKLVDRVHGDDRQHGCQGEWTGSFSAAASCSNNYRDNHATLFFSYPAKESETVTNNYQYMFKLLLLEM